MPSSDIYALIFLFIAFDTVQQPKAHPMRHDSDVGIVNIRRSVMIHYIKSKSRNDTKQ